jgi:hypothetical protein
MDGRTESIEPRGETMKSAIVFALTLILIGAIASRATARGMYFGAGIGNTFYSSEFKDAVDQIKKIDENATAWKIFGGFHGTRFLGIEGGYRHFGTVESSISGERFKSTTSGWDVEAIGRLQIISIVDLFAKAGLMFWSTDVTLLGQSDDDSGTDFFWGIGAGVRLGPIGARLEWESVEGGDVDNLSMVSLSATLGF